MNKGFVVLAQNTKKVNYVKCAEVLCKSIKSNMPDASVSIITDEQIDSNIFDNIIKLPYGDLAKESNWKLINDWQVYEASPYEYTIKLESDMFLPKSIDYWWNVLVQRELVVCTTIRNFKQEISDVRVYRRFVDDNGLPDCYNAITYFKKSDTAKTFFKIVRDIFQNWNYYLPILKCNSTEEVTTDWAYAIASHVVGIEKTTLPMFKDFSMVHMKQFINGTGSENWTDNLIYEILPHTFRINTVPQLYPVHYHIKNFYEKLDKLYLK